MGLAVIGMFGAFLFMTYYMQVLLGFGAGMIMPVALNYATHGVDQGDSGVASASVNGPEVLNLRRAER